MLDHKIINSQHLKAFGTLIKIHRLLQKLALRDLASKANLSHTLINKIEQGNTLISEESFQKLQLALNVTIEKNPELDLFLEETEKPLIDAVFHADPKTTLSLIEQLEKHEKYYLKSFNVIPYLIMKIGAYTHIHGLSKKVPVPYIQVLSSVVESMDHRYKKMFYLFKAMHHYTMQNLKEARLAIEASELLNGEDYYSGIFAYFKGRIESDSFEYSRANDNFYNAIRIFEKNSNFRRKMYAQLYININKMKIYEFEELKETFEAILQYAKQNNVEWLIYQTKTSIAIYEMLNDRFNNAMKIALEVEYETLLKYTIIIYSAMRLNDTSAFNKYVEEARKNYYQEDRYFVLEYGIEIINMIFNKLPISNKEKEKKLKQFYESAKDKKAYFELTIAYNFYSEFLVQLRKYKDAYEIAQDMLKITKKTLQ